MSDETRDNIIAGFFIACTLIAMLLVIYYIFIESRQWDKNTDSAQPANQEYKRPIEIKIGLGNYDQG